MNWWLERISKEEMDSKSADLLIRTSAGLMCQYGEDIENTLAIGCGNGYELRYLPNATGVDINPGSPEVVQGDMHELPFENESYDAVFSRDVFEHAYSHILAIAEMARVAKRFVSITLPGQDWGASDLHSIIPTLEQMIYLAQEVGLKLRRLERYNVTLNTLSIDQTFYLFEK